MGWRSPKNELVINWVGLKANKPEKIIRGKDVVFGLRKPKGFSKRLMGVKVVQKK